jgi:hypothetical protein
MSQSTDDTRPSDGGITASDAEIQINCRVTSIEEALIAKRAAHENFQVQALETDDGPLYRILSADGKKVLSPMFFSKNCMDHYITRMPLLDYEEWDNHPLKESNEEETNKALDFIPKIVVTELPQEEAK